MTVLLLALCGGLGAATRFVVDGLVRERASTRFPVGTVLVNVTGSLLLGLLTGAVLHHHADPTWRLLAGVGFCGGYTTFSTAMAETVRLVQAGRVRAAVLNAAGSLVVSVAAAAAGVAIMAATA